MKAINTRLSVILHILINMNFWVFLGMFFLFQLMLDLPNVIFRFVPSDSLTNDSVENLEQYGKVAVLYGLVVFAPIIETFIYQFSIIKLFKLVFKDDLLILIIAVPISALFFSLSHPYSVYYVVITFLSGLLFGLAFFIGMYRKDLPAFLIVVMVHSSWNLFAFIMDEVNLL